MSSRVLASVAALGLLVSSTSCRAAADVPKPVTHTVVIDGVSFQPPILAVKAGDTIVWVNKDPFPHTVTSEPGLPRRSAREGGSAKAGGFDSREIQAGESWKYTPAAKGEFPYVCTFHPTMKATLRVE